MNYQKHLVLLSQHLGTLTQYLLEKTQINNPMLGKHSKLLERSKMN